MSYLLYFSLTILTMAACSSKQSEITYINNIAMTSANQPNSVHDFTMLSLEGDTIPLVDFKGKVLLIVNVASKCGLTPQYKEIEAFYKQYKDRGVEVLGFPANNFLSQEPGSDSDIKEFCERNYGVSFPMFSKISVKGKNMAPLYQYLTSKEINGVEDAPVKWNFQKFLVDGEGKLVRSFGPKTTVEEQEFLDAVEVLLAN
jgi:glutathione peroxidase